uniref:IQ calmodulin-binding motif-containing protein 1-like n=1 Tax=Macrostomum lignano TaxID=282301 RepID=A0A1I8JPU1_9PLAT
MHSVGTVAMVTVVSERLLAALREPELNFDSVSAEAISQYAQQLIAESTGFSNADDAAIEFESDGNEISVDEASRLAGLLASGLQVESLESELSELCLALLRDRACVQLDRDLWLQDLQDCRREAGRLLGEARDLVDCLWRLEAALADCADQDADTSIIDTSGVVSVLADPRLRLGVPVLKALAGTYLDRLMSLRGFKADELGFAGRLDGAAVPEVSVAVVGAVPEVSSHLLQPSVLVVRWPTRPFYVLLPQRRLVWSDRPPALPPAPLLTREEAEEAVRRENEEFRKSRIRETSLPFIITLQAAMRGFLVRRRLRERRQLYSNSLDQIVAIQRWWRRCQRDRQLERRLARYNCYLSVIVQMQARARMVIARRAYKEQLNLYRSLERRVIRIQAWWRGCRVRQQYQRLCDPSRPVTLSSLRPFLQARRAQLRDGHKNCLLVRNRLTLQEVVRHSNRLLGDRSGVGGALWYCRGQCGVVWFWVGISANRQQVEKEAKKIELYQHRTPESLPLLQLLFNYLEGDREQYLYMRLFCSALPQELARLYRPAEVLSPTPGLGKLLSGMSKAGQVTAEQALEQPEVRSRLDANVSRPPPNSRPIRPALTQCRLPYSVRLSGQMHSRIPGYHPDSLARWLASPESHDVIDDASLLPLTPEQRRTLGSVAKMLQLAAANKGFGAESCSQSATVSIGACANGHHAARLPTLRAEFDMDEYSEMARLTVPTLHISVDDLQVNLFTADRWSVHRLLHLDLLDLRPSLTDPADPLAEILDELERVADGASVRCCRPRRRRRRLSPARHASPVAARHDPLDFGLPERADRPGHLGPARADPIDIDAGEERRHELLLKSRERLERQVRTARAGGPPRGRACRSTLRNRECSRRSIVWLAATRPGSVDGRLLRELRPMTSGSARQSGQAEAGAGQAATPPGAAGLETAVPGRSRPTTIQLC